MVTLEKGHGRLERRTIRTSAELQDYLSFPGLGQVGEIQKWVRQLPRGREKTTTHYFVTSLSAARADPSRLLQLFRGHWGIENRAFHVTDDSFGEDRQVLQTHRGAAVMSLLRQTALNLLRGRCDLWAPTEPLTGRAQRVCAHPLALLPALSRL